MKRFLILFISLVLHDYVEAQSPQRMSYQAVVRNSTNNLITNTTVGVRTSINHGNATGEIVYSEIQTVTTNLNGLMSMEIGAGSVVSGNFSTIDWGNGPYFITTEIDPDGGTNYSISGTQQLLSVPYALYAANAGTGVPGPQGPPGEQGLPGNDGPPGSANILGTTNRVIKFIDATTGGDSQILDDGNHIGIGAFSNLTKKLEVNGNGRFSYAGVNASFQEAPLITKATTDSYQWSTLGFDNDQGYLAGSFGFSAATPSGTYLMLQGDGLTNANCQALSFIAASDYRLKKDIQPISDYRKSIQQIRNIESITYRFHNETSEQAPHIGFVAQSLPMGVKTDLQNIAKQEQGDAFIGFNLSDMSGLLVTGIKAIDNEQQQLIHRIEEQQKIIDELTKRIEQLEKK